jgi:hypothetical protein
VSNSRHELSSAPALYEERSLDTTSPQRNSGFSGLSRQAKYVSTFQAMPSNAQAALKEIYHLAMQAHGGGSHVLMAYLYATQYPEIARLVIENVVLRFRLTQIKNTSTGADIQQRLEDFHVALAAFVSDISLEAAQTCRQQNQNHPPCHWVPKEEYDGFRNILTTNLSRITSFTRQCQTKTNKLKAAISYR